MNTPPPSSLSDTELHALVDGQLSAAERVSVEARLAQDSAAQATVARWTQQRARLRSLHAEVLCEPIPSSLLAAAQQTVDAQQRWQQWSRLGGMAAGVVLAFGAGWLANTAWQTQGVARMAGQATPANEFVRQARFAYTVYSPEVRHPVEVAAAERDHLVQWLSKRLGKPLKVPNLAPHGFELVGGRLLPGETGARAQFMFQNAGGTRVTLYLGALGGKAATPASQETAFRFAADGAVPSFYWVDQGFGYALSGPLDRSTLMQLADTVYRQLL